MSDRTEPIAPAEPALARRRAAVAFIFVTVLLDVLAVGVIIPVLPPLIEAMLDGDREHAARVYGLFVTVFSLMQFICAPVLGALSDRFGRRPVILISCFGLGLDYIVMALAPTVGWLFIGRVISGITAASYSAAGAYIADVTPPERRAAGFGVLGAAWGFGFVIGPAVGGALGAVDPRLPFWVAAGLALVNATYGLLVLPESLPRERRAAFSWRRVNPIGSLGVLRTHPVLIGLAAAYFLYWLSHWVLQSVCVLYTEHRYGWNPRDVGLMLAAVGVCGIAVQAGMVRPFVARFGERRALLTALAFGATGFLIYGLAPTGAAFWAGVPVFAIVGLFSPSLQSLMTRHVGPTEQGRLQGATGALMGMTGLIGPGLFTQTFAAFIGPLSAWHMPGAPFMLAAGVLAAALLLAWRTTQGAEAHGTSSADGRSGHSKPTPAATAAGGRIEAPLD